jgi:hypothetical protein
VLIVGELALELRIDVQGTTKALSAELNGGGRSLPWTLHEPHVGGFAAYAARTAAALHARVTICTTLPVPIPNRFLSFLAEHDPEAQLVSALPGCATIVFVFRCSDGVVLRCRRGTLRQGNVMLRQSRFRDFEVVVLDTAYGHATCAGRCGAPARPSGQAQGCTIAIRACRAWTDSDTQLAQDPRSWTFLCGHDARQILHESLLHDDRASDLTLARRVQVKFQLPRIALTIGPSIALLRHGEPEIRWVQSCPIRPAWEVGADEALLSVTALSSAAGADDWTSLNRGMAAASGYLAGLGLPVHLEELDAG